MSLVRSLRATPSSGRQGGGVVGVAGWGVIAPSDAARPRSAVALSCRVDHASAALLPFYRTHGQRLFRFGQ